VPHYGDEFEDVGQAIVLQDLGSMEALVITGSDEELLTFAKMVTLEIRQPGTAALLRETAAFDHQCSESQYTDTGDAWNLIYALADALVEATGAPHPGWAPDPDEIHDENEEDD